MSRVLLIICFMCILLVKGTAIILPLILKEVVDSIICDPEKKKQDWLFKFSDEKCRSNEEVYVLIGVYALIKLFTDTINYVRDWPMAIISARIETHIAHDVYDHVQRQSLAFHLNRETGKIIRIVSNGS
jgi:ABC-type multidrug transport system fused ATPase/permease subunit